MKRAHFITALAGLALVACDRGLPTSAPQDPSLAIVDGFNDATRNNFFFLFPIRSLRQTPPNVGFNPNLSPVVEVCEWTGTACKLPLVSRLTMTDGQPIDRVYVLPAFKEYAVLWRTRDLGLRDDRIYRISVKVGSKVLGFADVDVVRTLRQAIAVDEDEFVPLLKDFILPIRFWIGQGALCEPGTTQCASATISLAQGGTVVLPGTLDRVRIPAQPAGDNRVINVTLTYCTGINVDLRTFGPCLTVTADPPLGTQPLANRAVVSICSLLVSEIGLNEEQEELITMHRRDGEVVTALPHAPEECPEGLGSAQPAKNFFQAAWRFVARAIGPRPLYARTMMLDLGGGGETPFFSDFQFALPAQMDAVEGTSTTGTAGQPVSNPPGVRVTDRNGDAVQGATVHFQVTNENGTVTPATVLSNADGFAYAASWVLGQGTNTVSASGLGLAAGRAAGPYMPDNTLPVADQVPVTVGTGQVAFTATGTAAGNFNIQGLRSALQYPEGLWISGGYAYFTENNGRHTVFGGNVKLWRFNLATGGLEQLLDQPVNSASLVVNDAGTIYLGAEQGSIPGNLGNVSTVQQDIESGVWTETHYAQLDIAVSDLFRDAAGQIYVIGSSTTPEASSLYTLFEEPTVRATGLGTAQAVIIIGTDVYYARVGEIRRISEQGDQLVIEVSAFSLTTDGTWLYYAETLNGRIGRLHLTTGADETVMSGLSHPNAVRWSDGKLYLVEGGTAGAQFKDGTLQVITENVIP